MGQDMRRLRNLQHHLHLTAAMKASLRQFKKEYPQVRVVLVNRNGVIIGESP